MYILLLKSSGPVQSCHTASRWIRKFLFNEFIIDFFNDKVDIYLIFHAVYYMKMNKKFHALYKDFSWPIETKNLLI